jgi:hypothetical protein
MQPSGAQAQPPTALDDQTPPLWVPTPTSFSPALRETGDLIAAALGDQRQRELRTAGAAMSMDEAISYALANIDPKLLTGPVTFG